MERRLILLHDDLACLHSLFVLHSAEEDGGGDGGGVVGRGFRGGEVVH